MPEIVEVQIDLGDLFGLCFDPAARLGPAIMAGDLIIDVGAHNGDDTAFYLHEGYRVVAIEVIVRADDFSYGRWLPMIGA